MVFRTKNILTLIATLFVVMISNAYAEKSKDYGDYIVYYNAFTTDVLQAEVAKTYQIRRSKNRGMINISVQKKNNSKKSAITAAVSGTASNLTGQLKNLNIKEVKEGSAVYYISDFSVSNRETLDFSVDIKVDGKEKPLKVTFRQQCFTR